MTKTIVEWKKEYEIGVPEIDKQHMTLVKLVNDLYVGLENSQNKY